MAQIKIREFDLKYYRSLLKQDLDKFQLTVICNDLIREIEKRPKAYLINAELRAPIDAVMYFNLYDNKEKLDYNYSMQLELENGTTYLLNEGKELIINEIAD